MPGSTFQDTLSLMHTILGDPFAVKTRQLVRPQQLSSVGMGPKLEPFSVDHCDGIAAYKASCRGILFERTLNSSIWQLMYSLWRRVNRICAHVSGSPGRHHTHLSLVELGGNAPGHETEKLPTLNRKNFSLALLWEWNARSHISWAGRGIAISALVEAFGHFLEFGPTKRTTRP